VKDAPEMKVGDTIVYNKVGAYTMCLTQLFIKYFPAVYVEDENGLRLVRREWGASEYMQGSILEGDDK
jgi:diaminopimelate decarboxylase